MTLSLRDPAHGDHLQTDEWAQSAGISEACLKTTVETGLAGWGGRTRTQKCRRKISLCEVAQISGILHSMLQLREDRGNLILKLQTPLLEPCENLVGGRLFPRLDAIDISVDFVVALRESPELIIGSYHPLDKRDLLRKLIS